MHGYAFDIHPAQQHQHRHVGQGPVAFLAFEHIVGLHFVKWLDDRQHFVRQRNPVILAFLSPAIQNAIFEGRQPPGLTLERIVRKPVPLDWDRQARLYGFDASSGPP